MNIKYLLLPISTVVIAMTNSIVSADKVRPDQSVNTVSEYKYPPKEPNAPSLNSFPVLSAPYIYAQNRPQTNQGMIPTPMQARKYGQVPVSPQVSFNRRSQPFNPRNFGGNGNNNPGNNFPFSNYNMMPFGNSNNGFNPFSKGNMPFSNNSGGIVPTNPMTNMFGNNNQNFKMPYFNSNNNRKKAWGNKRNIWPDFYTDFTDEAWDQMMSRPRDMGRMPGGWRFPYISTPDPVTVSDAITNQFPPIAEEAANMADFSDWGIFDNK